VNPQTVAETAALAGTGAPPGVRVTGHRCDVSDESQVLRFRPGPEDMTDEQVEEARDLLVTAKLVARDTPPGEVRETLARLEREGKDRALLSAAEAATIILDCPDELPLYPALR